MRPTTYKITFLKSRHLERALPLKLAKSFYLVVHMPLGNDATNKATWNLDVSQFTDMAIYINNHSENGFTAQNTIANLYIDNIQYPEMPILGTPTLYYKNQNDFGKLSISEENKIEDTLHYEIIPYEQERNYEKPEIYDTSFSPICIGFANQDIKTNHIITNIEEPLRYDGSLLKRCSIGLTRISCTVSFDIHIINQARRTL